MMLRFFLVMMGVVCLFSTDGFAADSAASKTDGDAAQQSSLASALFEEAFGYVPRIRAANAPEQEDASMDMGSLPNGMEIPTPPKVDMSRFGDYKPVDIMEDDSEKTINSLKRAVANGSKNKHVLFRVGVWYLDNVSEEHPEYVSEGIKLCEQAADKNLLEAQLYLARGYFFGSNNITNDFAKSKDYLEKASKKNRRINLDGKIDILTCMADKKATDDETFNECKAKIDAAAEAEAENSAEE